MLRAFALDQRQHVFSAHGLLAGARADLEHRVVRIEAVQPRLRCDRVAVRRERVLLDQDLRALARRAVEPREHQVQVHRQRVHRDDFERLRADERRERRREALVVAQPRSLDSKWPSTARCAQLSSSSWTTLADCFRLQSERMAAEVDVLGAVGARRNAERVAQASRADRRDPAVRRRSGRRDVHDGISGSRIGRLGAASATNGATCKFNRYCPSAIESSMNASSVTVAVGRVACVAVVAPGRQAPENPMRGQVRIVAAIERRQIDDERGDAAAHDPAHRFGIEVGRWRAVVVALQLVTRIRAACAGRALGSDAARAERPPLRAPRA